MSEHATWDRYNVRQHFKALKACMIFDRSKVQADEVDAAATSHSAKKASENPSLTASHRLRLYAYMGLHKALQSESVARSEQQC